jgi:hypothetical protein
VTSLALPPGTRSCSQEVPPCRTRPRDVPDRHPGRPPPAGRGGPGAHVDSQTPPADSATAGTYLVEHAQPGGALSREASYVEQRPRSQRPPIATDPCPEAVRAHWSVPLTGGRHQASATMRTPSSSPTARGRTAILIAAHVGTNFVSFLSTVGDDNRAATATVACCCSPPSTLARPDGSRGRRTARCSCRRPRRATRTCGERRLGRRGVLHRPARGGGVGRPAFSHSANVLVRAWTNALAGSPK